MNADSIIRRTICYSSRLFSRLCSFDVPRIHRTACKSSSIEKCQFIVVFARATTKSRTVEAKTKSRGKIGQVAREISSARFSAHIVIRLSSPFCCRYPRVLRADAARRVQVGAAEDGGDDSHRGQMGSQRWADHADLRPERREYRPPFFLSCLFLASDARRINRSKVHDRSKGRGERTR